MLEISVMCSAEYEKTYRCAGVLPKKALIRIDFDLKCTSDVIFKETNLDMVATHQSPIILSRPMSKGCFSLCASLYL